jgi:hypothetical protein
MLPSFFLPRSYHWQAAPLEPRLTLFPLQDREQALQTMSDVAVEMLADFRATTSADKKMRALCAIDGGSGSGKTRLGFEFARRITQSLSLGNSLYLFVNLGNGSSPASEQLQWGVSAYLGLRVALQMLLPRHTEVSTRLVSSVLDACEDIDIAASFSLEKVLSDYSIVAEKANASTVRLPIYIMAHFDESQFMLAYKTWHPNRPLTSELAAKSMCRVLMEASMRRQVFFFPYLSGTYPMMSLKLFDPTEFVVKAVTCGQLSQAGLRF